MRVVNDGDKGLRNFVESVMGRRVQCQLDWFHIGMRLELLRKIVQMPQTYPEYCKNPKAWMPAEEKVSKFRNALWHGRSSRAIQLFAELRHEVGHLINHRMSKKQQMRWSPAGAHYLLQVRVERLNGTLPDRSRQWYPRFRAPSAFNLHHT